jgi:glycosyltransferase involved in cell wall biosynthesis
MRPLVSFVIPVRNDAARLRRCLNSITRNDYPRELIEIIVVDNGSTDESARVARGHGAIVMHSAGTSVAELRNRGAKAALGAIIAFADSDHEIDRNWVSTAVDVLSSPAVAATGAPYLPAPDCNWVQRQYDGLRDRTDGPEEVTWLGSGNLAVKRSAFDRISGFNASLTACEDVDLCNRLRLAGHRIVADPALRSVHYGDPKTLKALFFGELWRGRDNLRVTFSGPRTFRHLRSAIVPIVDLLELAAATVALLLGHLLIAFACVVALMVPAALRAGVMVRNRLRYARPAQSLLIAAGRAAQAMAVAIVFDVARALAILARGSHRARRTA